jgi:hypothetical protein
MSLPMVKLPGVPDRRDINPGMAYFPDTGPQGKTCGQCAHRGYQRQSSKSHWNVQLQQEVFQSYHVSKCAVFKSMTGRHGHDINKYWHACKYFEQKV